MKNLKIYLKKIVLILFVLVSVIQFNSTVCLATGDGEIVGQFAKIIDTPEDYDPKPNEANPGNKYSNKVGIVLGVIRAVGIVVSVISLMIIGIKLMTLSIEEKANYKELLPGYIFGVVLVIAFSVIPSIVYDMFY